MTNKRTGNDNCEGETALLTKSVSSFGRDDRFHVRIEGFAGGL
jgi:hypothetical protein